MALTAKQKREQRDQRLRDEGAERARREFEAANPNHDITGKVSAETAALNDRHVANPGAVPSATGEVARPQHAGGKVFVGCKLGIAFYDIQRCKMVEKFQMDQRGGRDVKEAERFGPVVRLRGTAYPRGTPPKGFYAPPEIVHGASLTRNVDRDFMVGWLQDNHLSPMVMNNMIFIGETLEEVTAKAREYESIMSGIDPVNPSGDARMPKSARRGDAGADGAGNKLIEVSDVQPGGR